jgi:tyrosyl-tRNA synthetase
MESGEGMAISEFSYPLFQAYDWWTMYKDEGIQLQIGGSDQYGNICAGMDAVSHMRKLHRMPGEPQDPLSMAYGLTTPLLTTASGEKFGKSAGNAVWLDPHMLSSFDLYQYFLRTADNDVERYLKLFTFLSLDEIRLLMGEQRRNESKRLAQHVLAKEIVELAHGAQEAKTAETAHKETFSNGTNTFSLGALRSYMASTKSQSPAKSWGKREREFFDYKKSFAAPTTAQALPGTTNTQSQDGTDAKVTLPMTMLQAGSFPRVLHAAGLASSRSDAHRLIANGGAYVLVPNSGSTDNPTSLQWVNIEADADIATADPSQFLVDFDALVLRSGKSKIQICRIITEEQFEAGGLTCPGWEAFKAQRNKAEK